MVALTIKQALPFSKAAKDMKSLYHQAFPPEERPPYGLALLFALRPAIAAQVFYDAGVFVGFAYTERTSQAIFVFLLAVDEAVRSRGYGSLMLGTIAEQAAGLPVVLCIEPMEETSPNYDQRLRRLAFYERNGFQRQGHYFYELDEVYEILATRSELDYHQLQEELNRLSLGLLRIRIEQAVTNL